MAGTKKPANRPPDPYLNLVQAFPLKPIRTEAENDEAIAVIALLGSRKLPAASERNYLDVLVGLVERFEAEQYPMPPVTGAAMVRHLMDARGLTQAEMAKRAGISESAFSEMLAGKRKMT